jgi:uncharacterized membrane protein
LPAPENVVRLLSVWDRLRESFWFVPALFTMLAIALASALLAVDRRIGSDALASAWLYSGGAEGARSLLSVVAGSMVTVVALAFSITIVSLQLAVAQLGPRLLRNFVRDRSNQIVLGTFVATFVYCLVVLRTVRGRDGLAEGVFVPHLAVTGAVGLALLSVALLIYFIHHAAKAIQADRVIAVVGRELDGAIDVLFPERGDAVETVPDPPPPRCNEARAVLAPAPGYVISLDSEGLLKSAVERDVVVHLTLRPGDFVIAGEPLAWVAPAERLDDHLAGRVAKGYVLGPERTLLQDLLFGVEQLTEIAVRSLASGHIDPATALRCIDRLGAAVARVSGRRLPPAERRDETGRVRVVHRPLTLSEIVAAAFTPIRVQGAGHRHVALRLLGIFERLARIQPRRDLHAALLAQGMDLQRSAAQAIDDPDDRAAVAAAHERLLAAIADDVDQVPDTEPKVA